jgi:hypothetical protein
MKKSVLYLLGILFCQMTFGQSTKDTSTNTIIANIPFKLTSHNNISIKAILNEQDTINLMFHTAAGSLTLIENTTQNLKSIVWSNENEVESWGGKSTARFSPHNSLRIGQLTWDSLAIWENLHSGPTTDGKFGPNLFEGQVIEINFDKSLITIYESLPSKVKNFNQSNLIYENGFMFIEGSSNIGNHKYNNRFLIHSGYSGSILYDDQFIIDHKLSSQLQVIDEKELKDSYGKIITTKKAILPFFILGDITFKNIPVGFFEGTIGRQQMSVIGGDILKRFNIIIDSERKYIYLKTNSLFKLPYTV